MAVKYIIISLIIGLLSLFGILPTLPQHITQINKSYPIFNSWQDEIHITLHKEVYDYFAYQAPRDYTPYSFLGKSPLPDDWEDDYYKMFLTNKNDEYVIKEIIAQITNITKSDGDLAAEAVVAFVQMMPYDYPALYSEKCYIQYPYEVLYSNKGVCGGKALLMTKLLNELGYGVALFRYEKEHHIAVGIQCLDGGSNYCFIESTHPNVIGYIPTKEDNQTGVKEGLDSTPKIIKISRGKSFHLTSLGRLNRNVVIFVSEKEKAS